MLKQRNKIMIRFNPIGSRSGWLPGFRLDRRLRLSRDGPHPPATRRAGDASTQVEQVFHQLPGNDIHEGYFGWRDGCRRAATRGCRGARQWRLVGRNLGRLPLALPPFSIIIDDRRRRCRQRVRFEWRRLGSNRVPVRHRRRDYGRLAGVDDNAFGGLLNRRDANVRRVACIKRWRRRQFGKVPICQKQQREKRCADPGYVPSDRHNHLSLC